MSYLISKSGWGVYKGRRVGKYVEYRISGKVAGRWRDLRQPFFKRLTYHTFISKTVSKIKCSDSQKENRLSSIHNSNRYLNQNSTAGTNTWVPQREASNQHTSNSAHCCVEGGLKLEVTLYPACWIFLQHFRFRFFDSKSIRFCFVMGKTIHPENARTLVAHYVVTGGWWWGTHIPNAHQFFFFLFHFCFVLSFLLAIAASVKTQAFLKAGSTHPPS